MHQPRFGGCHWHSPLSAAHNQRRILLELLAQLRPHWRTDRGLPGRIQSLLAGNRSFGSRDRRLYRELIYTTVRYLPWIEPLLESAPENAVARIALLAAESPATQAFRAAFAVASAAPAGDLTELLPAWFRDECPELFVSPDLEAVTRRAPLWLRAQRSSPEAIVSSLGSANISARTSAVLAGAIEVLGDADVTKTDAFKSGAFEIQDLGSQMVLASLGPLAGNWLDACAGAGGKTLQLAGLLGSAGTVDAHDIREEALKELQVRAARAGLAVTVALKSQYDGVLVDAPCSGSGTWRRSPHLKWTTTPATIEDAAKLQGALLHEFSARVARGGMLVYATCSLSHRENQDVVAAFLASDKRFRAEPPARTFGFPPDSLGLTIMPARHDSDGFFVAAMRRVDT